MNSVHIRAIIMAFHMIFLISAVCSINDSFVPKKNSISQKCLLLAVSQGVSQAHLARRLGMQPSNLNHYLKGHGDIHAELFVRLLGELGIDINQLLNRKLAALNDIAIEEKMTPGQALESVARALGNQERKALVSYFIKTAQVNLGASARPQMKLLKEWLQ